MCPQLDAVGYGPPGLDRSAICAKSASSPAPAVAPIASLHTSATDGDRQGRKICTISMQPATRHMVISVARAVAHEGLEPARHQR